MIEHLEEQVDGASVAFIRAAFAGTMIFWLTMHIVLDKITFNYYEPSFLFPYFGFDWLRPLPGRGLHLHFVITLIASVGMFMGVFQRLSSCIFAVGIIYICMLDKATYQNHYYFICLLAILFAVCPIGRVLSFDGYRLGQQTTVSRWVVWLFQFQIGLVYFFGGVAKISTDWLAGFPMGQVLAGKQDHFLIGPFCQEAWFVQGFVWSGMLFDLLIVLLLLVPKTRPWAFLMAVAFHLMNATLFRIGVFPWVMIFLTTIFFAPDWPRRTLATLFGNADPSPLLEPTQKSWNQILLRGFVLLFVAIQVVLPFRHFAFDENTSWTERSHHFSWHMKLRGKTSAIRFYAIDERTEEFAIVDLKPHLKLHQLKRMGRDPFMIRDFAKFIAHDFENKGFGKVAVRAFVLCSLNGRKPQLMVDPAVDLAQDKLPENWIVPLESNIGGEWDEPIEKWEQLVLRDPILERYGKKTGVGDKD